MAQRSFFLCGYFFQTLFFTLVRYLFLFLKFISAVCPTIEYDYTLSVDGL